ncbi:hypothetical protein OVN18_10015 [Microcella daejeonensis]|uniref:Uncharacterized protein n=1 Tax=Microcella daejeonensis TaxID=2994971 RepID=A0A9E8MJV1_9MICO|nr:hypothetical protein [Microcella daejeonensis]WAB80895.1 hypothetical protein OVN18_10015 [Microcella daejeonensis]
MVRRWWSGRAPLTKAFVVLATPVYLLAVSLMVFWIIAGAFPPVEQVLLVLALFGFILIGGIPTHYVQRRFDLDAIVQRARAEESAEMARATSEREHASDTRRD